MMPCLPYIILYKTCDLGAGPFLTPGSLFEKNFTVSFGVSSVHNLDFDLDLLLP